MQISSTFHAVQRCFLLFNPGVNLFFRSSDSTANVLSKLIPNSSLAKKDLTQNNHVNNHNVPSTSKTGGSSNKRARIQEAISYDDLKSESGGSGVSLKLQRTEGYYHGPMPAQAGDMVSPEEIVRAVHRVQRDMHEYRGTKVRDNSSLVKGKICVCFTERDHILKTNIYGHSDIYRHNQQFLYYLYFLTSSHRSRLLRLF